MPTGKPARAPGPVADFGNEDLQISPGAGYCSIDCSRLGPITPALLHRLSTVCEQSVAAGVPPRLVGASASLKEVFAGIAPRHSTSPDQPVTLIDACGGLMPLSGERIRQEVQALIIYMKRMQLPDLTAFVLRMLFEEAATNAMLHSGLPRDVELFWHLQLLPHKSVFTMADSGREFDPTTWDPDTGPVERAPGEDRPPFGIRLLRSLAQRIEYRRIDGALNLLRMERNGR